MAEKRRKLTAELREGAVRIVTETGKSVPEVTEDLGINETTLASWVSLAKRADMATPVDTDALIIRLTAENASLKKEDITLHGQILVVLLQLRVLTAQPGQFLGLALAPAAAGPLGPRDPARQRGLVDTQVRCDLGDRLPGLRHDAYCPLTELRLEPPSLLRHDSQLPLQSRTPRSEGRLKSVSAWSGSGASLQSQLDPTRLMGRCMPTAAEPSTVHRHRPPRCHRRDDGLEAPPGGPRAGGRGSGTLRGRATHRPNGAAGPA